MQIRYCPECDEEFQPHIERCSDCGGALESRSDEDLARERQEQDSESLPTPEEAVIVVRGVEAAEARAIAFDLHAAGIPFWLRGGRRGIDVHVKSDDRQAATAILERAGILPAQSSSDVAVAETGGPCPACGANVAAGIVECPTCGLAFAFETAVCGDCGEEVPPGSERCPDCGAVQMLTGRQGETTDD